MRRGLLILGVSVAVLGVPLLARAASSANYTVIDSLNAGGGRATSAQYDVTDIISPTESPILAPARPVGAVTELSPAGGSVGNRFDQLLTTFAPFLASAHMTLAVLVALTTMALAALTALTGLSNVGAGAAELVSPILNVFVAWLRRQKHAGRVYDVATRRPIVGATVRLITEAVPGFLPGKLVATTVTDARGEYRLSARSGQYRLDVIAPAYRFPSQVAAFGYLGEYVNADPTGNVFVDVPLDGQEPGTFVRIIQVQRLGRLLNTIRLPIMVLGSLSALLFVIGRGNGFDWGIALLYGVLWILEYRGYRLAHRQMVVRAANRPVRLAVVRAFTGAGTLLASRVTNRAGQVQLSLPSGQYAIEVSSAEHGQTRQLIQHRVGGKVGTRFHLTQAQLQSSPSWLAVSPRPL